MKGFFVNFNDFDVTRLRTRGAIDAPVPEGIAPAKQIEINYSYPIEGEKDVEARLVILCPSFKTYKGIQASKQISDGKPGKPAIRVSFDPTNPDHRKMLGSFGTKHDYRSKKGTVERVNEKYEEPSGVFGSLYDWCVNQYATFLSEKDGDEDGVDIGHLYKASDPVNGIKKKDFVYEPKPTDGEQGKKEPSHGKFLKLLSYKPGTPEENMAKFYLPDKSKADFSKLYDQGFEFSPFLSFRRIFIGANGPSVTMEVGESVITDFLERSDDMSARSQLVISKLLESRPDAAAKVAASYKALMNPGEKDVIPGTGTSYTQLRIDDEDSDTESKEKFVDPEKCKSPLLGASGGVSTGSSTGASAGMSAKPRLPAALLKPKPSA